MSRWLDERSERRSRHLAFSRSPIVTSATHLAAAALAAYQDHMGDDGPEVSIAGRIESWRPKGKVVFGHIEDPTGRIQVYLRRDDLGDRYEAVNLLDLDDHVGVTGPLVPHQSRRGHNPRFEHRVAGQVTASSAARKNPERS